MAVCRHRVKGDVWMMILRFGFGFCRRSEGDLTLLSPCVVESGESSKDWIASMMRAPRARDCSQPP